MEPRTPESSSSSASIRARLWRPAAQRNLRNQWSKIAALRQDWRTATAAARSHATAAVNSYLSQRYMDGMDFGVLKDMPGIQKKACLKLFKQQEQFKDKLLLSYQDMVAVVVRMANTCKSMRCYISGTNNSPIAQFSFSFEDNSDSGDGGGIPVFTFRSITSFEELGTEILRMFIREINLKRLLVMEMLSLYDGKIAKAAELKWSDEFYEGEFVDLAVLELYSEETCQPILPCLKGRNLTSSAIQSGKQLNSDVLQAYITTWMVEVNIDKYRVDEIFAVVGGEMRVDFLETSV